MAKRLQLRRGTTAESAAFTGAEGELSVDTTTNTLYLHDGATAGGIQIAKYSEIGTGGGTAYVLPTASTTVLGGVKVDGSTITIDGNGVITSTATSGSTTLDALTDTTLSSPANGEALVYNGSAWVNQAITGSYVLPTASTTVLGGVKVDGSTITIDGNGVITSTATSGSTTLLELTDVTGTPAANNILAYNADVSQWQVKASSANIFAATPAAYGTIIGNTISTADNTTTLGFAAGQNLTAGSNTNNTLIGRNAGQNITTASGNTIVGSISGRGITGNNNVLLGNGVMNALTNSSVGTVGIGTGVLSVCESGFDNTVIGAFSGTAILDGFNNTVVGKGAFQANVSGSSNTVLGVGALNTGVTGNENVAIGKNSLQAVSGVGNTGLGTASGAGLTTGDNNTFIGASAAPSADGVSNEVTIGNASVTRFRVPGIGLDTGDAADGEVLAWDATNGGFVWAANGAGGYSLPTASTTVLGGVKVDGTTITIDGNGVITSVGGAGGATALNGLTDVDLTTTAPVNNNVLYYNETSGLWTPSKLAVNKDTTPTLGGDLNLNGYTIRSNNAMLFQPLVNDQAGDVVGHLATITGGNATSTDGGATTGGSVVINAGTGDTAGYIHLGSTTSNGLRLGSYDGANGHFVQTPQNDVGFQVRMSNDGGATHTKQVWALHNGTEFQLRLGAGGLQFPQADGTSGQVLTTDGAGVLSWADAGSGGSTSAATQTSLGTVVGYTPGNAENNAFIGYNAGGTIDPAGTTPSTNCVYMGRNTALNRTTGNNNVAIGYQSYSPSGGEDGGSNNVAIGTNTLRAASTNANVAIGIGALSVLTTGGENMAIGAYSSVAMLTGIGNCAVGKDTLGANTDGSNNVALGTGALKNGTTGSGNIALGLNSGVGASGNNNIMLGINTGNTLTTGGNNVIIGTGAQPSAATISNEITFGSGTHTRLRVPGIGLEVTASTTTLPGVMQLEVLTAEPTTPTDGMVAIADGTTWDPAGTGTQAMVVYLGGAWRTLANA